MDRLEEKLYLEIVLDCENQDCCNVYTPDIEACDPMEDRAKRNAKLAIEQGWHILPANKIICPRCNI